MQRLAGRKLALCQRAHTNRFRADFWKLLKRLHMPVGAGGCYFLRRRNRITAATIMPTNATPTRAKTIQTYSAPCPPAAIISIAWSSRRVDGNQVPVTMPYSAVMTPRTAMATPPNT